MFQCSIAERERDLTCTRGVRTNLSSITRTTIFKSCFASTFSIPASRPHLHLAPSNDKPPGTDPAPKKMVPSSSLGGVMMHTIAKCINNWTLIKKQCETSCLNMSRSFPGARCAAGSDAALSLPFGCHKAVE
jgi:hypothetical protein